MRTYGFLSILAVLLITSQAQPARTEDSKAENIAESATKTDQKLDTPSPVPIQQPINQIPTTPDKRAQTRDTPDDPPDWVNFLNAFSTAVIALFTIALFFGLVIQISTSRIIERAWVMAEIQPDPQKPRNERLQVFEESGTGGDSTAAMNAVLKCSNAGKTPAWIEEMIAKFEITNRLPQTPNFKSAQFIHHSTIPLGMAESGAVPHTQNIQWTPIAQGHQHTDEVAVIYGRVVYRDIFAKRRSTTFGYKIRPHGRLERLEGYPEYNKGT